MPLATIKRRRLDQVYNDMLDPVHFLVEGYVFLIKGSICRIVIDGNNPKALGHSDIVVEYVDTGKKYVFEVDFVYENGYEATELEKELYGKSS